MLITDPQREVLRRTAAAALDYCRRLGFDAALTLALALTTTRQVIQESGAGTSENASEAFNFFGQKAGIRDGGEVNRDAWAVGVRRLSANPEWVNGELVYDADTDFYRYASLEDSVRAHIDYITGRSGMTRYLNPPADADALAVWLTTPPRQYATDPTYSVKLADLDTRWGVTDLVTALLKETPVSDILFGLAPSAQPANVYAAGLGTEKGRMDDLAVKVLALLKPLTRPGLAFDAYLDGQSYADNVAASNARGWTHHLALHTNADGDPNNDKRIPVMAFWYSASAQGKALALAVAGAVAKVNPYGLGACYAWNLAELKNTRAKAALIELREHDTADGARDIVTHLDAYARAVALGVVTHLNAAYGLGLTLPAPDAADSLAGVKPKPWTHRVVNCARLNVRAGAGTSAAVLTSVAAGARLRLAGGYSGSWVQVEFEGGSAGWVHNFYVRGI